MLSCTKELHGRSYFFGVFGVSKVKVLIDLSSCVLLGGGQWCGHETLMVESSFSKK